MQLILKQRFRLLDNPPSSFLSSMLPTKRLPYLLIHMLLSVLSACVAEVKGLISNIIAISWEIVFQWIPSHSGIPSNKRADLLVKSAVDNFNISFSCLTTKLLQTSEGFCNNNQLLTIKRPPMGKPCKILLTSPIPMHLPYAGLLEPPLFITSALHCCCKFTQLSCPSLFRANVL